MDGGQALAIGGNFYQLRDWTRCRLDQGARFDQGAERKGPRRAGDDHLRACSTPRIVLWLPR